MPTRDKDARKRRDEARAARAAKAKSAPKKKKAPQAPKAPERPVAKVAEPPGKRTASARNPLFPIGVNYYPLEAETQSWDDWYDRDVASEFAAMAEARMSLVRIFISWKLFEPQVGQYSDDAEDRLSGIMDAARDNKLQLIVTFFADDRLAELLEVPWGKKRDARTDQYLLQRETSLIQRIVNKYRSDPVVFAWDLGNEAFLSGFKTQPQLEAWVDTMREAVREVDPDRPILFSVDPETMFRHTGVDPRDAIDKGEIAVSHATAAYRAYASEGPVISGPSTYVDGFLLHSAARDLPVLMDDIGMLSLDHSVAEESAHVRTVLYTGLMNRASGVLLRRFCDLDTERREPYFRDPFEVLVGLVDVDGEDKPVMNEVETFARVAAWVDFKEYTLVPERTAVLIPGERYEPLPNLAGLYDPRACLEAYMFAKEAQLPVSVAREEDEFGAFSVLVVPSAFNLTDETWERLASFVQSGGALIYSYGGGEAHPAVRDLFGVEFLGDGGAVDSLTCRVAQQDVLGTLEPFDSTLSLPHFALLGHGGGTVVATDAKGNPLLVANQHGQGRAVFIATPVERALAQGDPWAAPAEVKAMMQTVYGAVASAAGCGAQIECDIPEVEVALFNGEGDDIVLLLNHSPEAVTANLVFERAVASISDVRGGTPSQIGAVGLGVALEPNGAASLRIVYA